MNRTEMNCLCEIMWFWSSRLVIIIAHEKILFTRSAERNAALAARRSAHLHRCDNGVSCSIDRLLLVLLGGLDWCSDGGSVEGHLLGGLGHGLVASAKDVEGLVAAGLMVHFHRGDALCVSALLHI
jgi:hypothetical protein